MRDETTKLSFRDDETLISITNQGRATIFNCGSTANRNEWLAALAAAQEAVIEESGAFIVSDNDDSGDSSTSQSLSSSTLSFALDSSTILDAESSEKYNDVLLALQDVRDSLLLCNLSMSSASEDQLLTSPKSKLHDQQEVGKSEKQFHADSIQAVCEYIETTDHGGRVILLHLAVLASANISLHDILRTLGERQRDTKRSSGLSSSAISRHKQHAGKFVRDLLFHPIYSQQPNNTNDQVQDAIDRYFPHCRLRRFSDDAEHIQEGKPVVPLPQNNPIQMSALQPVVRDASPVEYGIQTDENCIASRPSDGTVMKKMRPHSVPNILSTNDMSKVSTPHLDSSITISNISTLLDKSRLTTISLPEDDRALRLEPLKTLLWKFSSAELAEQLTALHNQQLRRILLWEFLHNPREAAQELTEHFNRLVSYFLWSVLIEETPKDRAEVIETIIAMAHAASNAPLYNFHLVMVCVGCLGDTPLMRSRLPVTWKKVRNKYMIQLTDLRTLCDHSGGFDNLRRKQADQAAMSSSSDACCFIPFIGVIGVALERLRMTNYLTPRKTLDLEKLDRQYQVLHVLESAIMKPPPRCHAKKSNASSSGVSPTSFSAENTNIAANEMDIQLPFQAPCMSFATPRLYQLRSQQIMASEAMPLSSVSTSASRTASALFLTSQSRTSSLTNSATSTASSNTPSLPSASRLSLPSSSAIGDDYHSPILSFRLICEMISSIPSTRGRVEAALEALFADDQQPATRYVRRFWLDLRQLMPQVPTLTVLSSIRECVSNLERAVLTYKGGELAQLSGLDETSPQLQLVVYEKLLSLIAQPMFVWVTSRVQLAMAEQEKCIKDMLASRRPTSNMEVMEPMGERVSSPLGLLNSFIQLVKAATQDAPTCSDDLVERMSRAQGSWVASHPVTSLVLLRNLLDAAHLTPEQLRCLDALEQSLSTALRQRSSG